MYKGVIINRFLLFGFFQSTYSGNEEKEKEEQDCGRRKIWKSVLDCGIVVIAGQVLNSDIGDQTKIHTLRSLLNIVASFKVTEQAIASGVVAVLAKLVTSPNDTTVQLSARCLVALSKAKQFADEATKQDVYPALIDTVSGRRDTREARLPPPSVLADLLFALGNIADHSTPMQDVFGSTPGAFSALFKLYESQTSPRVLVALSSSLAKLCQGHADTQNRFVDEGVMTPLMSLTRVQYSKVQLMAVEAVRSLLEQNRYTQRHFLQLDLSKVLVKSTGHGNHSIVRERSARALWTVADFDIEERRKISELMGTDLLTEFLGSHSISLHRIGCEGLSLLSELPASSLTAKDHSSAIPQLIRLLESRSEEIVVGALSTIRSICLAIGYIPRKENQTMFVELMGVRTIWALLSV